MAKSISIDIPVTALDVSRLQAEAEAEAPAIRAITVASSDEYALADEVLTALVRQKDGIVAMRKSATGPLYGVIKTIEGWFRPYVAVLEAGENHLKTAMGAYRVSEARRLQEAQAAATAAAISGDSEALLAAITAPATDAPGRATCTWVWRVARIIPDMVRAEDMIPDVAKFEAAAKSAGGSEQPPVFPGVVFERVARIGAKR